MSYGAIAFDEYDNEVVSSVQPFNFIKQFPIQAGRHTVTIPNLNGELEWTYQIGHPKGNQSGVFLTGVSVSGNRLTYTATRTSRFGKFFYNGGLIKVFCKR